MQPDNSHPGRYCCLFLEHAKPSQDPDGQLAPQMAVIPRLVRVAHTCNLNIEEARPRQEVLKFDSRLRCIGVREKRKGEKE